MEEKPGGQAVLADRIPAEPVEEGTLFTSQASTEEIGKATPYRKRTIVLKCMLP